MGSRMWVGLSMKKVVLRILAAWEAAPTLSPPLSQHSPVFSFLTLKKAEDAAHLVERLLGKLEALSSVPSTT